MKCAHCGAIFMDAFALSVHYAQAHPILNAAPFQNGTPRRVREFEPIEPKHLRRTGFPGVDIDRVHERYRAKAAA